MSEAVASSCLNKKCYPWAIVSAYYGALTAARAIILFEKGTGIRQNIRWLNRLSPKRDLELVLHSALRGDFAIDFSKLRMYRLSRNL